MSMKKKVDGQNKRKRNCMSMNKSGRTPKKKKKKFDDEVTLSHVGITRPGGSVSMAYHAEGHPILHISIGQRPTL